MKLNRKKLLMSLESVMPGLADKEIIKQSTDFIFKDGWVHTFNDEIAVRHKVDLEFSGAVRSKELYDFLTKSSENEIEIKKTENELQLRAGGAKAGIQLASKILLPIDEITIPKKFKTLPNEFLEGVKLCLPSCSKDMSREAFTNLFMKGDVIYSSDMYQTSKYVFDDFKFEEELLVPATSARPLLNYSPAKYAILKGWVHFKTEDDVIFSCRLWEGAHPDDFERFFKVEGKKIKFPDNTREILERVGIFSSSNFQQDEVVDVTLQKSWIKFEAKSDVGWIKEKARIHYNDSPINFQIRPAIFDSILSHSYKIIMGKENMKFEGEHFDHVISIPDQND